MDYRKKAALILFLRKKATLILFLFVNACATSNNSSDDQYFIDSKKYLLNLWDVNSDGIITCDDVERLKLYRFAYADRNTDGFLSLTEFRPAPWSGGNNADENHQKYDDNGDGNVSRDEFMLNADGDFSVLDSDNNCTVTDQEIRAYVGIL